MKKGKKVAVSWSGGKDACLALYRVLKENYQVVCLFSMISENTGRNHAHGVPLDILHMQANALGLPLILVDSADDYEISLGNSLIQLKNQYGIEAIVFGSLYSEEDRKWNEKMAIKSGLEPFFPVWIKQNQTGHLFQEFISLGFKAVICRASAKYFDKSYPGRLLDLHVYHEFLIKNICVMGEMGEYHSFVLDGPIFQKRVEIVKSEVVLNEGLWSLDIHSCQLLDKTML